MSVIMIWKLYVIKYRWSCKKMFYSPERSLTIFAGEMNKPPKKNASKPVNMLVPMNLLNKCQINTTHGSNEAAIMYLEDKSSVYALPEPY